MECSDDIKKRPLSVFFTFFTRRNAFVFLNTCTASSRDEVHFATLFFFCPRDAVT